MSHQAYHFSEKERLSEVPSRVKQILKESKICENVINRVHLIASELISNLEKYSDQSAEVYLFLWDWEDTVLVDIFSMDRGPGVADLDDALEDKSPKSESLGIGLGIIERQADEWDIYSRPEVGTVVFSRVYAKGVDEDDFKNIQLGAALQPCQGEKVSGDSWAYVAGDDLHLFISDGLGHGQQALAATDKAVDFFRRSCELSEAQFFSELHRELRKTRGVVAARCKIDPAKEQFICSGVGNIEGKLNKNDANTPIFFKGGTVGYRERSPRTIKTTWENDAELFLHTDGIKSTWNLEDYPEIDDCHVAIKSALLVRDFGRPKDDSLVVCARRQT